MADNLVSSAQTLLQAARLDGNRAFDLVKILAALLNPAAEYSEPDPRAQGLLLRALERRAEFGDVAQVLDGLAREVGLFPYLDPEALSLADLLAYEVHRPANLGGIVFHRVQAEVYRRLIAGESVILSAPTSFGKSLIIDAVIAAKGYRNVAIVVPTVALMDETRRRLAKLFGTTHKVVTHPSQALSDRNILVLTQERVVDLESIPPLDFFVIDEFYKLDPRRDAERASLLNQAFYRLFKTGAHFYLLGPHVRSVPTAAPGALRCAFIKTDYVTVASEVHRIKARQEDRLAALVTLCRGLADQTLIYCASPASARRVASALASAALVPEAEALRPAAQWIAREFHPDWVVGRALLHGVGVHHGRIPRALQQFAVREFNLGTLKYLVCTSTLIEGVNTTAKNVIVYDNKVATRKVDFFTFNNIVGRSGRMFQHFVGRVFLFAEPPQEELPMVDMPLVSQGESAAESLLIQMDAEDLSPQALQRIAHLRDQDVLSPEVLKLNAGIDPNAQVALAREIVGSVERYSRAMQWSTFPTWDELKTVCVMMWEFLVTPQMRGNVFSGEQLAFRINQYRVSPSPRALILRELGQQAEPDADIAVEDILDFLRRWGTFQFPRLLRAVDRIQRSVFAASGRKPGDYRLFAARLESSFLPPGLSSLDEYGIPVQVARKLAASLGDPSTLDEAIAALRAVTLEQVELDPFERMLVEDAIQSL